jgi:hypothetical protein
MSDNDDLGRDNHPLELLQYPTHRVVGVLDTEEQTRDAVDALMPRILEMCLAHHVAKRSNDTRSLPPSHRAGPDTRAARLPTPREGVRDYGVRVT